MSFLLIFRAGHVQTADSSLLSASVFSLPSLCIERAKWMASQVTDQSDALGIHQWNNVTVCLTLQQLQAIYAFLIVYASLVCTRLSVIRKSFFHTSSVSHFINPISSYFWSLPVSLHNYNSRSLDRQSLICCTRTAHPFHTFFRLDFNNGGFLQ